jgi:hypothetical protein
MSPFISPEKCEIPARGSRSSSVIGAGEKVAHRKVTCAAFLHILGCNRQIYSSRCRTLQQLFAFGAKDEETIAS